MLKGKRATTHWAYHDLLSPLGAIAVKDRVVRDGNLLTGGGITAGIDFALTLAAELYGDDVAQLLQLQLEYAPAPPYNSGDPLTAPKRVLEHAQQRVADALYQRRQITERAATRLDKALA
ncbi:Isonitrile hydratase [compost metagenome]